MSDERLEFGMTDSGDRVRAEQTKKETDEKCPQCGAVLDFDPGSGGLSCAYCGYRGTIDVSADAEVQELAFESAAYRASIDWGTDKKQIICQSCGAASIYDQLAIANACPFCGSNQVMQERGFDSLAPNAVAPFEISAEKAEAQFTLWLKRQIFAPSKAKRQAKADQFQGVYLPFWTFDANTFSSYRARYGRDRKVRQKDGSYKTVTDWYSTSGTYDYFIDDVTVMGSRRHDPRQLKKIEPYDFQRLKPYRPEYLAGFVSERYSIGIDDAWPQATSQIESFLDGQISEHIRSVNRADRVSGLNFSTEYTNRTYKYTLLPLWLSSFGYKDKVHEFLVNGQTGKVAGSVPISIIRVIIAVLCLLAIVLAVLYFANDGLPWMRIRF